MCKLLEVKELSFKYLNSNENTLHNINLSVNSGDYVALIGHNGSGKSTLAKLLMGLLEVQEGSIKIFDQVLSNNNIHKIRRDLGVVFQNPDNQFIGSTVKEDIAFGLENHNIDPKEMIEIIEKYAEYVGMDEFLDRDPTNLSGGQKQRIAIAGVLAMTPKLIIFDEATSMLDPIGKRDIKSLIKRINAEYNTTVISITHDIEEASYSDYIYVLNKGEIALHGLPEQVFSQAEFLKEIQLDIPFIYKINKELAKLNSKEFDFRNIDEVVEYLCQ